MKLIQINRLFSITLLALSFLLALTIDAAAEMVSEKASENNHEFILQKTARIEINETGIFLDEFSEAPSFLLDSISEAAVKLAPDTHSILLFWSFPQEEQPSITLCFEETAPASYLQLVDSKTSASVPLMKLQMKDQRLTVELDLSASHGQLLLALNNLQLDLHCKSSSWLQGSGLFGKVILADFVATPTNETAVSAVSFNSTAHQQPVSAPVKQQYKLNTTSEASEGMPMPQGSLPTDSPELTTVTSGSYSNQDDDQPPGKRPGMPSQPLQIVVLLPAMSHGAAGFLGLPDVSFQAFNEPADTLHPSVSGEHSADEPVVILQVTSPGDAVYQVEIDQMNWHRIRDRNLHRNSAFLYSLAAKWHRDKVLRKDRTDDLLAVVEQHQKLTEKLDRLLNKQADPGRIDEQIRSIDSSNFEFEQIWQTLSELMPDRLSVFIKQFEQAMIQELYNALFRALTADLPSEAPETITIQVKGIRSYGNGTTGSGTSSSQTPPSYSSSGTGSHSYGGGSFSLPGAGYGAMGMGGNGGAGGWQQSPPPSYAPSASAVAISLKDYLVYKVNDSNLRLAFLNLSDFEGALMKWMIQNPHLDEHKGAATGFRNEYLGKTVSVRGYFYAIARELGIDWLTEKLDPLNMLHQMSTKDIIWQTTGASTSLTAEVALKIISNVNVLRVAKNFIPENVPNLVSHCRSLGAITESKKEELMSLYQQASATQIRKAYAITKMLLGIQQRKPKDTVFQGYDGSLQYNFILLRDYLPSHEMHYLDTDLISIEPPASYQQPAAAATGAYQHSLNQHPPHQPPYSGRHPHSQYAPTHPQSFGVGPAYGAAYTPPPSYSTSEATRERSAVPGLYTSGIPRLRGGLQPPLRTEPVKRPLSGSSNAAPPLKRPMLFPSMQTPLQSAYILLEGLIERQGGAHTQKQKETKLREALKTLETADLHLVAFILGLQLIDQNYAEPPPHSLIEDLIQHEPEEIINAVKVLLDSEPELKTRDGALWARQIIAIAANKLSVEDTKSLMGEVKYIYNDMSQKVASCTAPLLCTMQWWSRTHGHGAFPVRFLPDLLSLVSTTAGSQVSSLVELRVKNLRDIPVCTEAQLGLINSLGASQNMISVLSGVADVKASDFQGSEKEALTELITQGLAMGTLSWEAIQATLEKNDFTSAGQKVRDYLKPETTTLPVHTTLMVTAPEQQTWMPPPLSTGNPEPEEEPVPSAPPFQLPPAPQVLVKQLQSGSVSDAVFGSVVRLRAPYSGLFLHRSQPDIDFLKVQLYGSNGFEEFAGGYIILPDNHDLLSQITLGTSTVELSGYIERIFNWMKSLAEGRHDVPDLGNPSTIRISASGGLLFSTVLPPYTGWPEFLRVDLTRQLAHLIAELVMKATGIQRPQPSIYPKLPAATHLKGYIKYVPEEFKPFIRAAIEINGKLYGMKIDELKTTLVQYSLIPGQDEAAQFTEQPQPEVLRAAVSQDDSDGEYYSANEDESKTEKDSATTRKPRESRRRHQNKQVE